MYERSLPKVDGKCVRTSLIKVSNFSKFFNIEDFDFVLDHNNMPYDEVLDEK